jgi:hypothetical protein
MAGKRVSIMRKRDFDFSTLVFTGALQNLIILEEIDVSQYIDCMFNVRIHGVNSSGGAITFQVFGDGYTEQEPARTFSTASVLFSSGVVGSSAPALITFGGTVLGSLIKVGLVAQRASPNPLRITASMDVILRCPDP